MTSLTTSTHLTLIPFELEGQIYRGARPNSPSELKAWNDTLKSNHISLVILLCSDDESKWVLGLNLAE